MSDFKKIFQVEGSSGIHNVQFAVVNGELEAHCDCQAGIYRQLCKHVLQCALKDDDVKKVLEEYGNLAVCIEYQEIKEQIEKLQSKSRRLKSKLVKIFQMKK